jgi:hypothetical protein
VPAEHHSRRRQPLGLRRQERRGIQGRRPVLQLPVADQDPGPPAPGIRLHAGHECGLRETKKSGFYDKNPGRETPILQMMGKAPDRKFQGRAPRQPAAGSRHHERGVRSDARRQQDAGRSTRPSSAATQPSAEASATNGPDRVPPASVCGPGAVSFVRSDA